MATPKVQRRQLSRALSVRAAKMIDDGLSNPEIGRKLRVSPP